MVEKIYLNWENTDFTWNNLNMTWEEVSILIEIVKKGGSSAYINGNPWDVAKKQLGEEKAVKFIKLVCRVNGLDYEKTLEPKLESLLSEKVKKTALKTKPYKKEQQYKLKYNPREQKSKGASNKRQLRRQWVYTCYFC